MLLLVYQESKVGWRSSALPSQGHHGAHQGKASTWDILAGDLSSGRSLFCITMDRRCHFQKGVSGVFFPFYVKASVLGFCQRVCSSGDKFPCTRQEQSGMYWGLDV